MKVLASMLVIALTAQAVYAEDGFVEARALNAKGRERLDAGDPGGALALFEQAYARSPNPALLLNIGTSYKRLGRNAAAANAYQQYLDSPHAEPARAAEVQAQLAVLDAGLGRLAIEIDPAAELQIGDGAWIAAARARRLRVEPGPYVLRARLGARSLETSGQIEAGEERAHPISFPPPRPAPVAQLVDHEPLPPVRRSRPRRIAGPIAAGAGIAALAGAGVLAWRSRGHYAEASVLCGAGCLDPEFGRARALAEDGDRDRRWAIGLGSAGAAAIAAGLYLWLRPTATDRALVVAVGPGQVGVTFQRGF